MKELILAAVLVLSALPAFAEEVYRDAGAGAYSFLKIDPGARAAALGGTGLLNSGELAVFTNPASLASVRSGNLSAGHNQWLGDATQSFLSWNFPIGAISCSIGSRFVHVGDLEMRLEATSEPVTTFSSWDISLHGGAGIRLGMFDLGIGLKVIREKVWTETSTGFAMDAGVIVHPLPDLDLAAAVQHVGPSVTMVEEDYRLPATWRLGGRYGLRMPLGDVSVSAEVGKPLDNKVRGGAGLEYMPQRWLALRFGMMFGNETGDFTSGAGLSAGSWTLDYAFVPTDYALGTVHRFTLHKSI